MHLLKTAVMVSAVIVCSLIQPSVGHTWFSAPDTGPVPAYAQAIIATADSVIVGGSDGAPGNAQWRIEKRTKATGALVAAFGTGGVITANYSTGSDRVTGLALGTDGFYVVGIVFVSASQNLWRIEKRDITTGALIAGWGTGGVVTVSSVGLGYPTAVAVNTSGVYIGGTDFSLAPVGNNAQWRVEKRSLVDGSLVLEFGNSGVLKLNYSGANDFLNDIQADASAIYLGGSDNLLGAPQWRFGSWNATTGAVNWQHALDYDAIKYDSGSAVGKLWIDASSIYLYGYGTDSMDEYTAVFVKCTKAGVITGSDESTSPYGLESGRLTFDLANSVLWSSGVTLPTATAITIRKRAFDLSWGADTYVGEDLGSTNFSLYNSVADADGVALCGQVTIGGRQRFFTQYIPFAASTCTSPRYPTGWQAWTDATITAGVTKIRKAHIDELRANINLMRADAGLAACSWTDPTITAGVTKIRKAHFDELRSCIAEVYTTCGQAAPTWTDPTITAGATKRRKIHLDELRSVTANAP